LSQTGLSRRHSWTKDDDMASKTTPILIDDQFPPATDSWSPLFVAAMRAEDSDTSIAISRGHQM
jgi:hypothetical protein